MEPGYNGGTVTIVIGNLHARKKKLIEQLQLTEDTDERSRIEHQLEQINTALDFLDKPEPTSGH
jgi:hypothetical protein